MLNKIVHLGCRSSRSLSRVTELISGGVVASGRSLVPIATMSVVTWVGIGHLSSIFTASASLPPRYEATRQLAGARWLTTCRWSR